MAGNIYSSKTFVVSQNALSTAAESIGGVNPARIRMRIRNMDASISVYYGHTSGVTTANGALIPAGASEDIDSIAEIWMIAASGTPTVGLTEFIGPR